jgi:hypothetical protein
MVLYVCIDMSFWRWSLLPKYVTDERLKIEKETIYRSHWTELIFYTIASVTDQYEPSQIC